MARSLAPSCALEELIEGLTIAQDHGGSRAQLAEVTLANVSSNTASCDGPSSKFSMRSRLTAAEREAITDALELAMQDAGSQYTLVQQAAERGRGDDAQQLAAGCGPPTSVNGASRRSCSDRCC